VQIPDTLKIKSGQDFMFEPARITALDCGEHSAGRVLKESDGVVQVESASPLKPGTPVQIEIERELLLGEVSWGSTAETLRIRVEHRLALHQF
jgi:hypothetical protein